MVHEVLAEGAENARTARELKDVLGLNRRQITRLIERERRSGFPICASVTFPRGYYLAESQEELQDYCKRLEHRRGEISKTLQACLSSMDKLPMSYQQKEEY